MNWLRFLGFNALGAALWVGTWVSLGYLAGDHITTIYHDITLYSYYVLIALAMLVLGYVAWRLRRRRTAAVASRAGETHESRSTSEAAGIAPGEPGRGAHASPGHEAEDHPPAGHQHGSGAGRARCAGARPGWSRPGHVVAPGPGQLPVSGVPHPETVLGSSGSGGGACHLPHVPSPPPCPGVR